MVGFKITWVLFQGFYTDREQLAANIEFQHFGEGTRSRFFFCFMVIELLFSCKLGPPCGLKGHRRLRRVWTDPGVLRRCKNLLVFLRVSRQRHLS